MLASSPSFISLSHQGLASRDFWEEFLTYYETIKDDQERKKALLARLDWLFSVEVSSKKSQRRKKSQPSFDKKRILDSLLENQLACEALVELIVAAGNDQPQSIGSSDEVNRKSPYLWLMNIRASYINFSYNLNERRGFDSESDEEDVQSTVEDENSEGKCESYPQDKKTFSAFLLDMWQQKKLKKRDYLFFSWVENATGIGGSAQATQSFTDYKQQESSSSSPERPKAGASVPSSKGNGKSSVHLDTINASDVVDIAEERQSKYNLEHSTIMALNHEDDAQKFKKFWNKFVICCQELNDAAKSKALLVKLNKVLARFPESCTNKDEKAAYQAITESLLQALIECPAACDALAKLVRVSDNISIVPPQRITPNFKADFSWLHELRAQTNTEGFRPFNDALKKQKIIQDQLFSNGPRTYLDRLIGQGVGRIPVFETRTSKTCRLFWKKYQKLSASNIDHSLKNEIVAMLEKLRDRIFVMDCRTSSQSKRAKFNEVIKAIESLVEPTAKELLDKINAIDISDLDVKRPHLLNLYGCFPKSGVTESKKGLHEIKVKLEAMVMVDVEKTKKSSQ